MSRQSSSKDFIIGAAIGGLLGTVAALMTAPKSGKKLRQDICDTYCDFSDRAHDIAEKVTKSGRCAAEKIGDQTGEWSNKAKAFVNGVSDWISPEELERHNARDIIIGSIAGVVLGAITGLVLAPKSGADLREDLAETYYDVTERAHEMAEQAAKKGRYAAKKIGARSSDWLSIAGDVIDQLSGKVGEARDELAERGKEALNNHTVKEILDWASLGVRVLQGIKKKG